jgi:hypothetical protein
MTGLLAAARERAIASVDIDSAYDPPLTAPGAKNYAGCLTAPKAAQAISNRAGPRPELGSKRSRPQK